MALYVGTSGWIYKHWAKTFYPEGVSSRKQLPFYAGIFNSVELNASFYRLPTPTAASIAIFFERIAPIGDRIGPVLWQLPPHLGKDLPRLTRFLDALPHHLRHAVEFREPSWYSEDVFDALRERNVAHVSVSSGIMPARLDVTTDFVYLRFHGLKNGARHNYRRPELMPWTLHARRALADGRTVYAYFNNDLNAHAPRNAVTFRELVMEATRAPTRACDRSRQRYRARRRATPASRA